MNKALPIIAAVGAIVALALTIVVTVQESNTNRMITYTKESA